MQKLGALRIMLVDDHAVVRAGYRRFLEREPDFRVVAEASSGEEAFALLQQALPDVVVLDLSLPGQGGLPALRRMKERWPALPVLVFSMHDSVPLVMQSMRNGACGYITKSSDPELMVRAVRSAVQGEIIMSPEISEKLAHTALSGSYQPLLGLSAREFEVFRLIVSGKQHEEIGLLLNRGAAKIRRQ